jgi:nitrogen fixation protein NifU and related proteins
LTEDRLSDSPRPPLALCDSCGSAIASSSLVTEWLKGKTVDQALQIKNSDIVSELSLPPAKIHCSVLAEDAIKAAVADYRKKQAREGVAVESA